MYVLPTPRRSAHARMPSAAPCVACAAETASYKCPTCRSPYCSVACYKSHRGAPATRENRRPIARDECDLKRRRREKTDDARRARAIETTCEPVRASTAPAVAERANETREQPSRAFEEDSEDELGTRARREDLQRVADDASVREKLRSERLREIIRAIDAAKDGEKALAKAREDPEFRAFTEDALSLFER